MKQKIFKITALGGVVLLTSILLVFFAPINQSRYIAAIKDKHKILERTPSPRIIFIGGSNLAYGLDSRLIQEKLGYNVVNMGLHAMLGIRYLVNEIKSNIKEGDIIVIVPEYPFFFDGNKTLLEISLFYPMALNYMDLREYLIMAKDFPVTLQRRFEGYLKHLLLDKEKEQDKVSFFEKNFTSHGDYIGHLNKPRKKVKKNKILIYSEYWKRRVGVKVVAFLNQFHTYLAKKKAKLYFGFCPRPASYLKPQKKRSKKLYRWLKKNSDFGLLGRPIDFMFPDKWFYDSISHLTRQGRYVRTLRLIRELKKVLPVKAVPSIDYSN
jgi:hypothetical protein